MVPDEAPRQNVKLEEIMKPAVSVSADAPAREALKIMREHNLPGVPVVGEGGKLEGFITDGQLMASALPQYMHFMPDLSFVPESADQWVHYLADAADRPVREVMGREVSQVELGKSELAVAHKMVRDGVSSVVITREGEVVGIVNRLDLYAAIEGID
jgi:CBS domain-containing protein